MGRPKAGRGRPKGSKTKSKEEPRELPKTVEELRKLTGPLKLWARPIIHAYDALMQAISDEALDEQEKEMGQEAVAALIWYYGLTHPLVLTLLFVGGTTVRRAPAIVKKMRKRREPQLGIPGAVNSPVKLAPPVEVDA